MKQKELDEILRLHKLWLAGEYDGAPANLIDADLSGADLADADLANADLTGADLSGATLKGADLEGADLKGAGLKGAILQDANLSMADLSWARLHGVNLRGANLSWAILAGANIEGADLEGANIDYACWPLWCGSFDVKICSRIAAQLAYHMVRACRSVAGDADVVAFCNDPIVLRLANRFHRADECGRVEAAEGDAK
jgi:hypothetical protein